MTTSVVKRVWRDLARRDDWPLFSTSEVSKVLPIGAVTLSWTHTGGSVQNLQREIAAAIADQLCRLSHELRLAVHVFVLQRTAQPRSAIVLYRKIWRMTGPISIPSNAKKWPESMIDCGDYIRFAGIASVPLTELPWAVSLLREYDIAIPILLPLDASINEDTSREWALAAMPPDGCRRFPDFDWPSFLTSVGIKEGVAVRYRRDNDLNMQSVDFFARDSMVSDLNRCLSDKNDTFC